ncbi:MAG: hypothetical protein JWL97_3489 [Gemmatimonadales bacterium]|nr:hypothetical protein [Gemmatimonadales bacterium]
MPSLLPVPNPSTWAPFDPVTAARLRADVAGAVAFHTARPYFSASQSSVQTVTTSTWTGVTLDNAAVDTAGGHSNTASPSRYVCKVAGWYLAVGTVAFASHATALSNTYIAGVRVNGSNSFGNLFEGAKHPGANTHAIAPMVVELVQLAVGDYIELAAYQNSGGSVSTNSSSSGTPTINYSSQLSLTWVASATGTAGLPVPSEATWTDGIVVTSAALNSNIRDAVRFLTYPPIARIYYNGVTPAAQALPNNAFTTVSFDGATVDNYGGWGGTGTNPTRWTAPVSGHYLVAGYSAVTASFTGKRAVGLKVNGTSNFFGQYFAAVAASGHGAGTSNLAIRLLKLNAADYVEVQGFQSSGASSALSTGNNTCRLIAVWMCA